MTCGYCDTAERIARGEVAPKLHSWEDWWAKCGCLTAMDTLAICQDPGKGPREPAPQHGWVYVGAM